WIVEEFHLEISDVQRYFLEALPGLAILSSALIWRKIRRARTPGKRFQRQELSRDEIIKARSKLVRNTNKA
ncbi:MAG: hypothetical protein ACR2H1_04825, partial [Limisphaerales bacterium]